MFSQPGTTAFPLYQKTQPDTRRFFVTRRDLIQPSDTRKRCTIRTTHARISPRSPPHFPKFPYLPKNILTVPLSGAIIPINSIGFMQDDRNTMAQTRKACGIKKTAFFNYDKNNGRKGETRNEKRHVPLLLLSEYVRRDLLLFLCFFACSPFRWPEPAAVRRFISRL